MKERFEFMWKSSFAKQAWRLFPLPSTPIRQVLPKPRGTRPQGGVGGADRWLLGHCTVCPGGGEDSEGHEGPLRPPLDGACHGS